MILILKTNKITNQNTSFLSFIIFIIFSQEMLTYIYQMKKVLLKLNQIISDKIKKYDIDEIEVRKLLLFQLEKKKKI